MGRPSALVEEASVVVVRKAALRLWLVRPLKHFEADCADLACADSTNLTGYGAGEALPRVLSGI